MFAPRGALRLRMLSGPRRPAVTLRGRRQRIGRSRDNDILLPTDPAALSSGHHAEVVRDGTRWFIQDLRSKNGTWLNGARIDRSPIVAGDRLTFGDVECRVEASRVTTWATALAAAALLVAGSAVLLWLPASSSGGLQDVAAVVARSLFLVAVQTPTQRHVVGTAFVVGPNLLATNAHVADALATFAARTTGARSIVVRSDSGDVVSVEGSRLHAAWTTGSLANDVAVLQVSALPSDAVPLRLAEARAVAGLARGVTVATLGFPATATDAARPRGRLRVDVLGDVRDGLYLAVGLAIAPGTSGSPIFLDSGLVIGLVTGGDFTAEAAPRAGPSPVGANWGISIAVLKELLAP